MNQELLDMKTDIVKTKTRGRPRGTNNKIWTSIRLSPELMGQIKQHGKPTTVIEIMLTDYFKIMNEMNKK